MPRTGRFNRRCFLQAAAASSVAAPLVIPGSALGADGATPASERIVMGAIGMGGQGRGDLGGFLGFPSVQVVAVCDVVGRHRQLAKDNVDQRYGNKDCQSTNDFHEITGRRDLDAVLIATPDHWHAIISIEAMQNGKDVYCEKPECLTIREGRRMVEVARRYGRIFSGGSQRVWGDYNWFHKMVRGGAIGDVTEAWVNVGGPSGPCFLPPLDVPNDVDWNLWLGPAPWRPFHPTLIAGGFRPFRDYSGGGMTDWGCHTFGGALFALGLHETGPVEVIPPDGKEYPQLTYVFANGVRIYHGGGWDGILNFRGSEGEISEKGDRVGNKPEPPDIYIPNYKGQGGIFGDFLQCVRTRELPFRDIERAHRTSTVSHLGNIAYWLDRRLKWDPVKEEIVGDPEANRWLDRPKRALVLVLGGTLISDTIEGDEIMKSYATLAITLLALALSSMVTAADLNVEVMEKLDKNLAAACVFEHGQNSGPLMEIEQTVFTLPRDSQWREAIEQKLIGALEASRTNDAKAFLCRQLRVIGTEKCIPGLERLLIDPPNSAMAVYALGYLEYPEACRAMHRALLKTTGSTQVGIINALADRDYQQARADLIGLLGSTDTTIAEATARALGKLGGTDSARALQAARANASPQQAIAIDNALLTCAENLIAAGAKEQAAAIYASIRREQKSSQFQVAALRGLVLTRPADAVKLMTETIQQGDSRLTRDTIAMINMVEGQEATASFVSLIKSVPPATKVLLLRALGNRGDTTASAAIALAAGSDDETVRLAALESLGGAGDASAIATLAKAAASDGEAKRVARASLLVIRGAEIDQQLLDLSNNGSEQVRIEAIEALAGRAVVKAVAPLLKIANDSDAAIRQAAIRALGSLAEPSDLPAMLGIVVQTASPDDRIALVAAVGKLLSRVPDTDKAVAEILPTLRDASAAAKPALLQILGKTGSPTALPDLRSHLKDASGEIRDAAVQAIAEWPDASVLDDLLGIIETARNQSRMELALRGYVRLANTSDDPTSLFARVLRQVKQTADKKLVLAGLGTSAESPGALEMAFPYLNDKDLGPTAGLAVVRIAYRLRASHERLARAALDRVVKEVDHEDVRQRAQEVINDLDKYEGHILTWVGVGPFVDKGKDGAAIYQMVFDPEKKDVTNVKWSPVDKGIGSWEINLEAMFGGLDHCAAYLRTHIWAPTEQDALLEMGSDDAVKAWVNGELVFNEWTVHGASPRQHHAAVHLSKGWNDLMLKVVDFEGGWVVGCRVRKPDGTAIEGLKVEAK